MLGFEESYDTVEWVHYFVAHFFNHLMAKYCSREYNTYPWNDFELIYLRYYNRDFIDPEKCFAIQYVAIGC